MFLTSMWCVRAIFLTTGDNRSARASAADHGRESNVASAVAIREAGAAADATGAVGRGAGLAGAGCGAGAATFASGGAACLAEALCEAGAEADDACPAEAPCEAGAEADEVGPEVAVSSTTPTTVLIGPVSPS
jgi:hypothetical protein